MLHASKCVRPDQEADYVKDISWEQYRTLFLTRVYWRRNKSAIFIGTREAIAGGPAPDQSSQPDRLGVRSWRNCTAGFCNYRRERGFTRTRSRGRSSQTGQHHNPQLVKTKIAIELVVTLPLPARCSPESGLLPHGQRGQAAELANWLIRRQRG